MKVVSTPSTEISLPYHVRRHSKNSTITTTTTSETINSIPTSTKGPSVYFDIVRAIEFDFRLIRRNRVSKSQIFVLHDQFSFLSRIGCLHPILHLSFRIKEYNHNKIASAQIVKNRFYSYKNFDSSIMINSFLF